MSTERRHASRPSTGRRHAKDVLLFHRAGQMGCNNEYGWGSQPEQKPELFSESQPEEQLGDNDDYGWVSQAEQQLEELEQLKQMSESQPLLIGPPPGLEHAFGANPTMPRLTSAMLAPCGPESLSLEAFFGGPLNHPPEDIHLPPATLQTPKSSLHICLMDCIDDASTVASDHSPALFPRDLIDAGSAHSSPTNLDMGSVKEGSPQIQFVPSLAEALSFAPITPKGAAKASTPISLECTLGLSPPTMPPAALQEGAVKEDAWALSQASFGMVPMGGVCPWWPNFNEVCSPSNNTGMSGNLMYGGFAGYPDATTFWPAGAWGHSMHTNSNHVNAKASSGATETSEIYQI